MDQVYKAAQNLQFKLRDYLDDPNSGASQNLTKEVQRLIDEIEMKRPPMAIVQRAESVMRMINIARDAQSMDHSHADDLYDRAEDIRQNSRAL